MSSHGFSPAQAGSTVGDALGNHSEGEFFHVRAEDSVSDALRRMVESDISIAPVLSAPQPVVLGEVIGSVDRSTLREILENGDASASDPVAEHLGPPLDLVGINESLDTARNVLATGDAVLVARDGKPVAVLTRSDLLEFLTARTSTNLSKVNP